MRPYLVRRDGTLLDRATETIVGRVWLTRDGLIGENLNTRHGPFSRKYLAAREAWEAWARRRT